jgi:hypothetical protein
MLSQIQFVFNQDRMSDIHEAYIMAGDMICGTRMVHLDSPEHEEARLLCFLALRFVSKVDYSFS